MTLRDQIPFRYRYVYDLLVRLRHSNAVEALIEFPQLPSRHFRLRGAEPFFAVDICGAMGMGGLLNHVVRILKRAETFDLIPVIASTNPLYASQPGRDWFPDYFIANRVPPRGVPKSLYHLPIRNEFSYAGLSVPMKIDLDDASRLFHAYFRLSDAVEGLVQEVNLAAGVEQFPASVHFRSTDKRLEALAAQPGPFLETCKALLAGRAVADPIFLATDDYGFEIEFRKAFADHRVFTFNRGTATSDTPRHFSGMTGRDKALEALVNMALISRSEQCVRTRSYLSAWSKVLNPQLKTHTVNRLRKTHYDFPETEISDEETEALGGDRGRSPVLQEPGVSLRDTFL